jgi:hypothetical protein
MAIAPDSEAQERAARWLAAWDGQGVHRTATAGDNAGAEWLAEEAAALGADVLIEEFAIERLDPISAFLEIGGTRIEAVPAFDAPATGPSGVVGHLGLVGKGPGGDADIGVAELGPLQVHSGGYEQLRRTGAHRGFVILCAGESPGMGLLNAERFREPYGTPAIHVSSEAREAVLAASGAGAPARLVAQSRRTTAYARNVVVAIDGTEPAAPPLVVMTPRSSWWQSTAERGGGIVCWLESLRALLAEPPPRPVVFTANTGHELGHLGLDEFLALRPGWERPAGLGGATWVHYGANLGAAGGTPLVVSPYDVLRDPCSAQLAQAGQPYRIATKSTVPNGETRDIQRAGGHCVVLVGDNKLFHLPQDRWPDAVDLAAVTRIARAAAGLVLELARHGAAPAIATPAPSPTRVIRLAKPGDSL